MEVKSVKFNFIMNFILTASSILFPLITFPYVSRILLPVGNGKVAFALSVVTYFAMFASLGIPTYGIRACAKVRDDREELSKVTQELMIINGIVTAFVMVLLGIAIAVVPKFQEERELLIIASVTIIFNFIGVLWFYSALEQYEYITTRTIIFKLLALILMFVFVREMEDYKVYCAITVIAGGGSNVLNFLNLRKYISFRKVGTYEFHRHMKPILVFFAMSAAISVYTNLDVVMLGFMTSDIEVGYYNAAIKVKVLLISLITSLGTVLLPRLSYYLETGNEEKFREMIEKAFNFVWIFGTSVMVYFILFAEESILFLAGSEFLGAVTPMIWLMPTVLLVGLSNVSGIQMLTPMGLEKRVLISILWGAGLDLVLNLVLISQMGATGAAIATLVAELAVFVVQIYYLRDYQIREILLKTSIRPVVIACVVASVVSLGVVEAVTVSVFFTLCISGVVFFGIYGGILWGMKEPFVVENGKLIIQFIRNKRG